MSNIPECFNAMMRAWNEKDRAKVRGHLDTALAPNVVFADPNYLVEGIDAFEEMVLEFHEKYPISTCEHTSGLDHHHNRYRYKWLVSVNGTPALPGMDVVEIDNNGQVIRVDGFFGPFLPMP